MSSTDERVEQRTRISEAARALLEAAPWDEIASRTLLVLVRPPDVEWAATSAPPLLWLILDGAEARALRPELRNPLVRDGSTLVHVRATDAAPAMQLAAMTSEAVGRHLEGVTRRSLEMKWLARYSEALHDPLHRFDSLRGMAARLPADALERVARPLYVQAAQSLEALAGAPMAAEGADDGAVLPAVEAAGALCRLACVLEGGSHPPAEWLLAAARETTLGRRLASWLDDVPSAVSGDQRPARWIRDSGAGVLREAAAALRAEFAGRDWLDDPIAQTIRAAR
ncbi:MAG: hypothetical protein K1X87_06045 [Dehalococcoidia bacterium]|nr:hypothetical protein [Dehalococcoidia bacterium]